jgi:hypothetical protein
MELSWRLVDSGGAIETGSVQPTCFLESLNTFYNITTLFIRWYCQFETIEGKQKHIPVFGVMAPLAIK